MSQYNVGDLVAEFLSLCGVSTAFGIVSLSVMFLRTTRPGLPPDVAALVLRGRRAIPLAVLASIEGPSPMLMALGTFAPTCPVDMQRGNAAPVFGSMMPRREDILEC